MNINDIHEKLRNNGRLDEKDLGAMLAYVEKGKNALIEAHKKAVESQNSIREMTQLINDSGVVKVVIDYNICGIMKELESNIDALEELTELIKVGKFLTDILERKSESRKKETMFENLGMRFNDIFRKRF
jgi:2-hydroxy-3-keto-5-methylthiopentenyl-1-phosphate phosphatase